MSRIGKKPLTIPEEVKVEIKGQEVTVEGSKGQLFQKLPSSVVVTKKEDKIYFKVRKPQEKSNRALWGLARVLVANMVKGVIEGYEKKLEIHGVGYRVNLNGRNLIFQIGFSHPINFDLPKGIEAKIAKNVIIITGIDKQLVGETAARIRNLKKPEPYKGKGIKYTSEVIRRKAGKVVKGVEGT